MCNPLKPSFAYNQLTGSLLDKYRCVCVCVCVGGGGGGGGAITCRGMKLYTLHTKKSTEYAARTSMMGNKTKDSI